MKKFFTRMSFILLFAMSSQVPAIDSGKMTSIQNPKMNYGVNVGDVLVREVSFEVESSNKLDSNGLPKSGTRVDDIELISVNSVESNSVTGNKKITLTLEYQVFSKATDVSQLLLPEEIISFTLGQKYRVPAWKFWFSPLAKTTFLEVKSELKPFASAPLLNINRYKTIFLISIGFVAASILTLIYLNMDLNWIPMIGGPFSRAYSKVRRIKSKADANSLKKIIQELHVAFDELYGQCFFEKDIKEFLVKHPKYEKLNREIEHFFILSNRTLFGYLQPDSKDISSLVSICKNLRDCERGAL